MASKHLHSSPLDNINWSQRKTTQIGTVSYLKQLWSCGQGVNQWGQRRAQKAMLFDVIMHDFTLLVPLSPSIRYSLGLSPCKNIKCESLILLTPPVCLCYNVIYVRLSGLPCLLQKILWLPDFYLFCFLCNQTKTSLDFR